MTGRLRYDVTHVRFFVTRLLLLVSLALLVATPATTAQVVVRGVVVDASTDRPLPNVHVIEMESRRGTVTNRDGRFEMVVPVLPGVLTVRHIGYLSEQVHIDLDSPRTFTVLLDPSVIPLDEVVVAGDDLADNVMRKVIRRKQEDWRSVMSWSARAYLRTTLAPSSSPVEAESSTLSIRESMYDIFSRRPDGVREVLLSYRETDDAYTRFSIEPYGYVPNFYDDEVVIAGRTFVGPTSPDALDVYTFSFAGIRSVDDQRVYDIYVAPRTDQDVTLIGKVSILADESLMVESYLRPARHVGPLPPRTEWEVNYSQQFYSSGSVTAADSLSGSSPWVPVALTVQGWIGTEDGQRTRLEARLSQTAVFGEYTVNESVPPNWFRSSDRLQVDSNTVYADYLFTLGANVVALTPMELRAYEIARRRPGQIGNASTFRVPGPRDFLTLLTPRVSEPDGARFAWLTIFGYTPFFRYNRVDGLLSGIGQLGRPQSSSLVDWHLAQSTGWRKVRYRFRYERMFGESFWIGGVLEKDAFPNQVFSRIGESVTAVGALTGRGDYFDYHTAIRKTVTAGMIVGRLRISTGIRYTKADSISRQVSRSWPSGNTFRSNPSPPPGEFAELTARVALGQYRHPFGRRVPSRVEVNLVASPPGLLDSQGYAAVMFEASGSVPTVFRKRYQPAHLDVRMQAGVSNRATRYQWSLDGTTGGFAPFGGLRTHLDRPSSAERGAAVFWRHDFGRIPFDVLGIDRARILGAGVNVHGAHAVLVEQSWHHEIGFGISDLLGLPIELTLSRNYAEPRWLFGFTLRN
jgi:hypothetical protein